MAICLFLFSLSLILKNIASNAYWEQHDSSRDFGFFWMFYDETDVLIEVWEIEAYIDASYYYEPYLYNFRYLNWNPYAGGEGPLDGYAYGPIFIYGLYLISLVVSLFNPNMSRSLLVSESVKWTHIAFDSLCVVMLYLIIISLKAFKEKKVKKHIVGFLGAFSLMLMPINLLYVDSIYLNIPQMTLFTMIAFLLFMREKYKITAFMLTIAWLSKQMPLFLLAPWFLIIWKKKDLRTALVDFLLTFLLTSFIISLPWMFVSPYGYFAKLFGPGKPLAILSLDDAYRGSTVTLAHTFLYLGSESLAQFYKVINDYMIPFLLIYVITLLITYFRGKEIGNDESLFTLHTTWMILISHTFLSRGVYKYYDAFFTPFIVLIIILYLDKFICFVIKKLRKDLISEVNKGLKGKKNKEKTQKNWNTVLQESLFYVLFLGLTALFYYFNFIIITKSRFLHPLYLLIFFAVVSVLFPPSIFKSLFETKSYKMLKEDVISIFQNITQLFKKIFYRLKLELKD
ncbi:MAG: hypothetical protein H7647_06030 [Candidatus Heimdallarchaeota archaeon]|nr:hypothetical protein [Candidatus Heimdallarchaeota archaeon]MCK4253984.1 hypothetical protein [Candidatus Heimdallarchaeota archaeon]